MPAFVRGCAFVLAIAASGCGEDPAPAAPTPAGPTPTLVSLRVEPTRVTLPDVGATQQVRAVALLSDRTERDVTTDATWGVSDPRILTIASGGLARAVGYGAGFYSASYQGLSSTGGGSFVVAVPPHLKVAFTGVVRDQHGRPVPGAGIGATDASNVERPAATTDGNGFFDLGAAYGAVRLHASKFGHDNAALTIVDAATQPRAELVLVENPSPYIERSIEDELQAAGEPVSRTHRIVTRVGATVDLIVEVLSPTVEGSGTGFELYSGSRQVLQSSSFPQVPGRFKAEMTDRECRLIVTTRRTVRYRVTYREPR